MQSVQQTMARTDLDISYITSRILVMPCPSEGLEATYKTTNNVEDVKLYLEARYQLSKINVYNLGPRTTARLPPPVRTVECSFIYYPVAAHKAPQLQGMYSMAEDMYGVLAADPKAVIIVQSGDNGRSVAATMVSALFMYARLVKEPEDAMQIFAVKRMPPQWRPSELRYLYYMGDLCRSTPHLPHFKPVTLVSLQVAPVPAMTKARDGCRMFIEIVSHDRVVLTTMQDYDRMRLYHVTEGKIALPLNVTLCGDVTVSVYHARNALKGALGGRAHGIKVCQLQLHTGFIPEEETLIHFDKAELDELPDIDHIPGKFHLSLSIFVGDMERPPAKRPPWEMSRVQAAATDAQLLFDSSLEYEETIDNFVAKPSSKPKRPPPPKQSEAPEVLAAAMPPSMPQEEPSIGEATVMADLLNISQPKPSLAEIPAATKQSFDLLGSFETPPTSANVKPGRHLFEASPAPDLLSTAATISPKSKDVFDDIFGSATTNASSSSASNGAASTMNTPLKPMGQPNAMGQQQQPQIPPPEASKKMDPFSNLDDLATNWMGLGASNSGSTKPSPIHQQQQQPSRPQQPSPMMTPPRFPSTPVSQRSPNEQPQQQSAQATRPDYSRTHFAQDNKGAAASGGAGSGAAGGQKGGSGDIFADILGSQGYSFGSKTMNSNRSINEMRKEEMVKEMDPEKIRILEWVSNCYRAESLWLRHNRFPFAD